MKGIRTSGVLLHPTCLPSPFGIGDMGPEAYRFADLLAETGQQYWQILPVTFTDADHGHSPYHSLSAFAGDPLWISPQLLIKDGWLESSALTDVPEFPADRVDFSKVRTLKLPLLEKAFERFLTGKGKEAVRHFIRENGWLSDFALFRVLTRHYGKPWSHWPVDLRDRRAGALQAVGERFSIPLQREAFLQYLFFQQWKDLRRYCNDQGIQFIGDMPIYLPFHSAEVWANPYLYKLTQDRSPLRVSGVPPDYFSETGQLWGHPVYDWEVLVKTGFDWWVQRTAHNLKLFDRIRIDHFRGWVACWEVPGQAQTAVNGEWVPVPGDRLLDTLFRRFGCLPLIAEDLGTITADVRETMARFDLPGMKVLLFAFGDDYPYGAFLPHNYRPNCVVYTGTHDNNTVQGWFSSEATDQERNHLYGYLGKRPKTREIHWEMIRLAMASVADTAIIPLQDLLGLDEHARMNSPAGPEGNWQWRAPETLLPEPVAGRLTEMTRTYGRAPEK
ncbi:MAG: 4-alpha-glucanotransferase [Deltaproteobacteria bacterium]|nr:4-alpha-glucanotransferase [Deltaproteobacteria bacterium]